ncbi:LuxR C-terminal-related transcriptional regulator [Peristeroidobacter soli]|uniref:LuxR C-terminal-related transcriptional regulator n=1 Tax=Peristeroidobacter soli TaxID=2497877 RepID=UPI00158960EB|nr:LuxR C-terminal-related transcriptional regulator [Peristeroidobacter soli]
MPRPQIDDLLDSVLQHAVTVIEAPAGHGKTAALWQWYRTATRRDLLAIHIKVEESVRTPEVLFHHLNDALAPAGVRIENLSWSGIDIPTLVLIDDFPADSTPELDEAFGILMRNIPADLHVAVTSRVPVRWPICKLLLRGHAQRFDGAMLRFTQQEVATYFSECDPNDEGLACLEHTVRGWPAALHILRLSHQHLPDTNLRALTETPPELAIRFVLEQVLKPVPNDVLDLLIIAAALQRADAALLDVVREADDSHVLLQKARDCGVPLLARDGVPARLHPFVEACLSHEVTKLGESRRRHLHLRAQKWYLEQSDVDAAVHHSTLARDPRKVFESINAMDGVCLMMRNGASALERVFQHLPQQLLPEFPRAAVARSFLLVKSGRLREARSILQSLRTSNMDGSALPPGALDRLLVVQYFLAFIEDRKENDCDEEESRRQLDATLGFDPCTKVLIGLALSNARLRRGDLLGAIDSVLEAEFWSRQADVPFAAFFVYQRLCALNLHRGRVRAAREYLERAASIAAALQKHESQPALLADILGSAVYLEQNDSTSEQLLQRSLPRLNQIECLVEAHIAAYTIASRAEYERHGLEPALQVVTRAAEFGARRHSPRLVHAMRIQHAELLLLAGETREALAQLSSAGVQMNGDTMQAPDWLSWLDQIQAGLALARALRADGDLHRSLKLCADLAARCEAADAQHFLLRCRLLEALAHRALGQTEQATAALRHALYIAAPERASRAFIDEGAPMLDLLRSAVRTTGINQLSTEVVSFVASILGQQQTSETTESKPAGTLLSPREQDVLNQLSVGHSNKVIARKLDLTENTVKFHLRSLYEKLGVGCRMLAVEVAREKGMLAE